MPKFKLEDVDRVAKGVSRKAQYPISNADDLAQALGGRDANVNFAGKSHKAAEVEQIPDEYFPIESEEDFVAKMASLAARSGNELEGMPRGKQLDARPAEAGDPPRIPPEEMLPPGKAGYKGWKRPQ